MSVTAYEATIENGQVKFDEPVNLPERARVYVLVPKSSKSRIHMMSTPHLKDPSDAADFVMEVTEEPRDAGVR